MPRAALVGFAVKVTELAKSRHALTEMACEGVIIVTCNRSLRLALHVFVLTAALSLPAAHAAANVLWNNGPFVNCPACGANGADASLVQTSLSMLYMGISNNVDDNHMVAEDFIVGDEVWDVTRLTFFGFFYDPLAGLPVSAFDDLRFQILDGPPGQPGSTVVYGDPATTCLTTSDWTGSYRDLESVGGDSTRAVMRITCELPTGTLFLLPGTYWIVWQNAGTGSGPYVPLITINGETTTGNAMSFTPGTQWIAIWDAGSFTPQGLPFIIEGSEVANYNPGSGVVRIPLVTLGKGGKSYKVQLQKKTDVQEFKIKSSQPYP